MGAPTRSQRETAGILWLRLLKEHAPARFVPAETAADICSAYGARPCQGGRWDPGSDRLVPLSAVALRISTTTDWRPPR